MRLKYDFLYVFGLVVSISACKGPGTLVSKSDSVLETMKLLEDSLGGGHLGLLITEAETGKVLAAYNAHKYFVPASNTKLLSLYAGLKYLPDSLVGLRYRETEDTIYAQPTGDPTLLISDYKTHPVAIWLMRLKKPVVIDAANWKAERYGRGWTWSDYQASYQPERSALPVYGNIMPVFYRSWTDHPVGAGDSTWFFQQLTMGPSGEGGGKLQPDWWNATPSIDNRFRITRDYASNGFEVQYPALKDTTISAAVPFVTKGIDVAVQVLKKLPLREKDSLRIFSGHSDISELEGQTYQVIFSQAKDSMLKPMMHRSDNFFAEQTLLMASNEYLGYMSDREMIDTMMKTVFKDMPDKPVWADGSGLSRYNLQTPANYIWLLDKLRKEYPMERLKEILPTGNDGTLTNYYKDLSGKIFAKTGTLSGVVALSGYLYAKSGNLLLFSALVNNHNTDAPRVRRLVEKYLIDVWAAN